MIPLKFVVEMEIPEDVLATVKGVKIDTVIETAIENALFRLHRGNCLVYRAEEGKKPIDLYQTCPSCGHPWAKHFSQLEVKRVQMPEGQDIVSDEQGVRVVPSDNMVFVQRGTLTDPVPVTCSVCEDEKRPIICQEALKYAVK